MIHTLKLKPVYYDYILHGTKRIELRLNDEKRRKLKLGDTIKFLKEPNLTESFEAKIVGLLYYENFINLINDFDISLLADKSITKDDLLIALQEFYTEEKQKEYGVVGIKLELKK